jgi:ANTAR domain/PAS fold
MTHGFSKAAPVDEGPTTNALVGGSPRRAGWFRFHLDADRWEWAPEVSRIHGYELDTMTPDTDQVLSHGHPDDHARVVAAIDQIRRGHGAFSTRYRIIDARGHARHVLVEGDDLRDEAGDFVGRHGFYIDVTPTMADIEDRVTETVAEITSARAVIDQAKGMLSVIYDITGETAFAVLRWRSQVTNTKLRALAEQLIVDFRSVNTCPTLPPRATYDRLLLTGHERIERGGLADRLPFESPGRRCQRTHGTAPS